MTALPAHASMGIARMASTLSPVDARMAGRAISVPKNLCLVSNVRMASVLPMTKARAFANASMGGTVANATSVLVNVTIAGCRCLLCFLAAKANVNQCFVMFKKDNLRVFCFRENTRMLSLY